MKNPVIIIGAGGHANVLIDALKLSVSEIIGIVDADPNKKDSLILGVPVIGDDETVLSYNNESIELVNAIGSVSKPLARKTVFERFKKLGYSFASVIHPSAVISPYAELAEGAQVMAGAVIQPGCHIGENVIVNTRSSLDHDCHIGEHSHIAPGVTLSGGVIVGESTHIGTGAIVIQGIEIARNCMIAAGAVVIRNMNEGDSVMGLPARIRR